jgi:hypothetical protein
MICIYCKIILQMSIPLVNDQCDHLNTSSRAALRFIGWMDVYMEEFVNVTHL